MALNTQQAAFVRAYIELGSATKAAIAAGYSKNTANQIGYRLLKHPEIATIINRPIKVDATQDAIDSVDRWQSEMSRLAFQESPTDDFKYDHKLRALDMIAKAEGRYASESGNATAFAIQINLGGELEQPVDTQQVINRNDD